MSDLKCINCESTETLMTQTINGDEQRICSKCNSEKMEDVPSDALVTIEVTTSPASPCFKQPLAIRTNRVVGLIKTNTVANKVAKPNETIDEYDGDRIVVDDDDDDIVVDEAMPSDNDLRNNINNNNNAGNDDVDVGVETVPEIKVEKRKNQAVLVLCEGAKPTSTSMNRDPRILLLLAPPLPQTPKKNIIDLKALKSEFNQQQKQGNDINNDDGKKCQENKLTIATITAPAAAGTIENGSSLAMASVTAAAGAAATLTKPTTSTTAISTTTTSTKATKATAKVTLAPPSLVPITPTPSKSTIASKITPASKATTIQVPKAKPVLPTKSSPTIVRRLRKSTRTTRFRSKMAGGNGSASGAGNASGPSGSQNHQNPYHHHHVSHIGSGNNAHSAASSKGQNKGGRSRRTLFKRAAVKTPIMHATTRFVTSVFFNGSYFQIGDIVSLVDGDNMLYYAQIRGLLVDAYCEKSAYLSWLLPTQDSPDPKVAFDPATYLIGPDEDFSRKLTYLKFVMHAPSNYFHDRTTPFPLPDAMNPDKHPGGYIWTHLPMEEVEIRTDEE